MLLRDAVRELADDRIAPRAAEIDQAAEWPDDMRRLLADHDIFAIPFAEAHGGLGADLLTLCLAIEQISRDCATSGLILAVQALGAIPIQVAGTPEQQDRWLPGLASGEKLIAFGLTEADAGSDPSGIRTRAVRDGDEYVIDGGKRFISHASVADYVVVFAVTNPDAEKPSRRLSAILVETDRPGFKVTRVEHKMGIRGSPTAELAFDGVRVPVGNRLGEEGQGFADRDADVRAQPARDRRAGRRDRAGRPRGRGRATRRSAASSASRSPSSRWSRRCSPTWTRPPSGPATCCTPPARRSRPARRTPPAGRPSVNSSPATRPCGSRPTPCRSWAATAISTSTPWSG